MDDSPRKRMRVATPVTRVCGTFRSSYASHVREALHVSAFRASGLALGVRMQVLWTIRRNPPDAEGGEPLVKSSSEEAAAEEAEEAEEDEEDVWWSCTLEAEVVHGGDGRPAHRIRYDASDELGFDEETREVVFLGTCGTLLDLQDGATMPWRLEDSDAAELTPGVLAPGTKVKAHYQGGEKAYAGQVHAVRYDYSQPAAEPGSAPAVRRVLYDILYEDHELEEGVPAELVSRTEAPAGPPVAEEEIVANSIDDFFAKFVQALMSGQVFNSLSADRKVAFAECVQRSRPHFESELNKLVFARGYGITVTALDITTVILPAVMPHVTSEFRRLASA